ncbi:hypothetical protein DTO166G4_5171 [Paecilomyces variotii]|nr:hypothetical protein DTO166G4_5171 [Paecilomyces variotii]KAJ9235726.1 hypothetical protein DTO166G5_4470 [Paecilomyces variotii]KAJ9259698.1 hypothetical protein DTO195F2_4819 [Paecilomyces variotii]KAJ9370905.1 hypothetical protein DTO282E5_4434 [Paecilomyces variotii]
MKAFACTIAAMMAGAAMAAPAMQIPNAANLPSISAVPTPSVPAYSSLATPAAALPADGRNTAGELVTGAGKPAQKLLTIAGQDSQHLLVQLSPAVSDLVSGLGLPEVGVPVGTIISTASSAGDLAKHVAPEVKGLLTVAGTDGGFYLVQLAPSVASLLEGLALPGVGVPVGSIVSTVGDHVKRAEGKVVSDAGNAAQGLLTVTGQDAKQLLIQLSPEVTALVSGLGLPAVGVPVGQIVASASSVGDLLKDLAPHVNGVLHVVSYDGGFLLMQLAPSVAGLLSGLGLPALGVPIGSVVQTVGEHL